MTHRRLWISAAIIACVILVAFALSVPHTRDVGSKFVPPVADAPSPVVSYRDTVKKGTHTISGSIEAPNACTELSAEASVASEGREAGGILLALTMPEVTGICLQVPTRMTFEATVAAPASVPIVVTVNGVVASTTPA